MMGNSFPGGNLRSKFCAKKSFQSGGRPKLTSSQSHSLRWALSLRVARVIFVRKREPRKGSRNLRTGSSGMSFTSNALATTEGNHGTMRARIVEQKLFLTLTESYRQFPHL